MKSWQRKASELLAIVLLSSFVVGCSSQSNPTQSQANALATNANPSLVDTAAAEEQEPLSRLLPVPPNTSTSLVEVVKLVQAGMEESVILAYIDRCPTAFEPTVDEILYLNDLGVSAKVISALIRHGEIVREEPGVASASTNIVAEPMADGQPPTTTNPAASQYATQPTESDVPAGQTVVEQTQPPVVVATAPPPAMPAPVSVFYNDLAPYGSWVELDGYGWCWQPTTVVVNPSWRPYADQGRWLYTDCGWYWQSDYSWGWAPFHYGRWLSHRRCGWVWVPDTVWGPSWVSWRNTPSYCGWAPLPPNCHYVPHYGFTFGGQWVDNDFDFGLTVSLYSFIHWRHFNDHNPHGYYVPRSQTAAIYSHSKVVNNYVIGSNNTIINDGVNWDRLAAYRPTKLRPISVRELSPEAGTLLKPDRVEKNGQSLVIYRPQLQTATPPAVTLKGPRAPESPATRAPMPPPAGQALAAPSRNSDLVAGRTEPARSSVELPGRGLPARTSPGRTASLSDTRPVLSQPLAAPATTSVPRPTLSTPLTAPSIVDRGASSVRPPTSNPRSQTTISRSTTQGITIGRTLGNSRRSSISAPSPSTTLPAPSQPSTSPSYSVTTPSRNNAPRSSASSFTVPRTEPRAPTSQRTAPWSTRQPSSSTRAPAPSWTPPTISTPAPRQPVAAPYSSPTPSYSSPSRQPSYSAPAPSTAAPTRSAPMSAPSVSRSPDPTPSRTPSSPSPSSTSRDSSSDSKRDAGSRR